MPVVNIFESGSHAENILQRLWRQCDSEELCDVILIAGTDGKRIPAHRCILSAASPYFRDLFVSPLNQRESTELKLPNVNGELLESLIEYCYTGRIVRKWDTIFKMLEIADMLHLSEVVEACGELIAEQLHPQNCLGFRGIAERFNCQNLLQEAHKYILEHYLDVYQKEEFVHLNASQLAELLARNDLAVFSESDVFESLVLWLNHERNDRERHLAELLKLIRLPLLEQSFLIERVKPLCSSVECQQIYVNAMEWQAGQKPKERNSIKPRKSYQSLMGLTRSLTNKKIYLHYYCEEQREWLKWRQGIEYRCDAGITVMGESLFIVGGQDSEENVLSTVICLNLKTMTLKSVQPMTEVRSRCRSVALNGFLYAIGGWVRLSPFRPLTIISQFLSTVEKWNQKTNKWSKVASISAGRSGFGVGVLEGKIYVVGGSKEGTKTASVECYDPHENVWKIITPLNEARILPDVGVSNGFLYAVGGQGDIKTVERYDPKIDGWTMVCSLCRTLPFNRLCTILRDKFLVFFPHRADEFDHATNEWKTNEHFKALNNAYAIFTYSDKALVSAFIEEC